MRHKNERLSDYKIESLSLERGFPLSFTSFCWWLVLSVLLRDMQWMVPVDRHTCTLVLPVNPVRCSHARVCVISFSHFSTGGSPCEKHSLTCRGWPGMSLEERTVFVLLSLLWHRMSLECCVCHYLHLQLCRTRLSCMPVSVLQSFISRRVASAAPLTSLGWPIDQPPMWWHDGLIFSTETCPVTNSYSHVWFEVSIVSGAVYTNVSWNPAGLFPYGCASSLLLH